MEIKDFIVEELKIRERHYKEAPASIIEHYNIEQQNIQSYNGRQLLELLQNADDASERTNKKKVLIKLENNQLIIANNGEPFTEGGFRSILYSNLSPKVMEQNKIGQKGLGFRSVLSWADEINIKSGSINLRFSEETAHNFLALLIKENPTIQSKIMQMSKTKFPIAVLRVPNLQTETEGTEKNFDTVISLNLKKNIISDVQAQINTIVTKEALVFLNHIKKIWIISPERKCLFRKTIKGNKITIDFINFLNKDKKKESKTWTLNKNKGEHEYIVTRKNEKEEGEDLKEKKNFELAIAWNDNLDDTENVLFTYFKTEDQFPFPALLHGTFELNSDRKHLINDTDGHNKFLVERLAELLIDSALKIASQEQKASYKPLQLLNIDFENICSVLKGFNFKDVLIKKIKESKIFPTVN
jgi:hypothetical protein